MPLNTRPSITASCVVYVEGKQTLLLSLKQLLEPAFEVVAMADNALSLVDAITSLAPAIVVIDMGGPAGVGSIVRHVRHRFPAPALIVLTDDADPVVAREARAWGVEAVVVRTRAAEELCAAAREALAMRETASTRSRDADIDDRDDPHGARPPSPSFTPKARRRGPRS